MKYRLLALLAVISLIVAACGSGDSDTTTTAAAGGGDDDGGGATAEVIDIDFWVAFSDYRFEYAQEKAAAFNANHPEYNVQVTSFASYNDAFDAAVLAVDSGQPPALIHFFEAATRQALDAVDSSGNPIFKSVTEDCWSHRSSR